MDLGGNCGFFPVLAEIVARSKFGDCHAEYHVFEAMRAIIPNIASAARQAQIEQRVFITHGAVGKSSGQADFSSGSKSFLDSSAAFDSKRRRFRERVSYVDLGAYMRERKLTNVDVLKIDIEGSEYDLIETFPELFENVALVFIELHDVGDKNQLSATRRFLHNSGRICLACQR